MRLPILNKLSGRIELHSLFLQPTYWCTKDCKGCYVKERNPMRGMSELEILPDELQSRSQQTPVRQQAKLIELFCNIETAWANEITIAMDDFPLFPRSSIDRVKRNHMVDLSNLVFNMIRKYKLENRPLPKMHMTFNTIKSYCAYIKEDDYTNSVSRPKYSVLDLMDYEHLQTLAARPAYLLDMINFSNLNPNEITKRFLKKIREKTPVNYNHLIPRGVNHLNIEKYADHLTKVGEIVDHIYLVIYKTPVGRSLTRQKTEEAKVNMANDIFYIDEMNKRLPKDILQKINIDGCLLDSKKYNNTGYGCSGNISKMQVWPNGKITGCAYKNDNPDYQSKGASNVEELIWNLKNAKGKYDFTDAPCYIPEVLKGSSEHFKKLNSNRFKDLAQELH